MRALLRLLVVFVVSVGALLATRAAHAQAPTQEDEATVRAREHFKAGVKLYDAKPPDYEHALEQFRLAYADKSSPAIKRNIALCLRALGRYPEAMDALDEMLAEGGVSLKPEVHDSANKMLAELDARVASLRITVQPRPPGAVPLPTFAVTLDGVPLAQRRLTAPVRVLPGEHIVQAGAPGLPSAEQRVTVAAGEHEVHVNLEPSAVAPPKLGRLTVHAEPPSAEIAVDGVVLARGEWTGNVGTGPHHVEVRAPGYTALTQEVQVHDERVEEISAHLESERLVMPKGRPQSPHPRQWYVLGGLAVEGERLTLNHVVFGGTTDVAHGFGGAAFEAKVGRKLGSVFGIELAAEVGSMSASVPSVGTVSVTDWTLAPEVVVRSHGRLRFKGGVAVGAEGQSTKASLPASSTVPTNVRGGSVAGMGLVEAGIEYGSGALLFAASLFADIHGIGAVASSEQRLYWDSPGARAGLRAFLGYQF